MELEGSLPCSQQPVTGPCLESDVTTPHPPYFPKIHSDIIFSVRLGLLNGFFPAGLLTKILYAFLICPVRATCPGHYILLDLITLPIFSEVYKL